MCKFVIMLLSDHWYEYIMEIAVPILIVTRVLVYNYQDDVLGVIATSNV